MLNNKFKIIVWFLCGNLIFSHYVFAAKNDANQLAKINKEIEKKKKATAELEKQKKQLSKEILETQNKMVSIANNVTKYEKQLSGYDKQLSELRFKERLLNKKIEKNNAKLIQIIAVFENISQVPKGYLLISPSRIDTVFQSSILLRTLIEQLNVSKIEFKKDLSDLIKLKDDINQAKASISKLNSKVKKEKDKIADLIKSKKTAQRKLTSEQKKTKKEIDKLVAESKTIEECLKKAEKLRKEKEKQSKTKKTISKKATGTFPLPVDGEIITYYGEKKTTGVKSKGLYIKPRSNSQVVSPSDADVVFAGNFYGYKNLLILHSSDDYYIIMGGMNRVFAEEGQTLLAGEPIGEMGNSEFYVEIRDKETPINPLKYFKV